MIPNFLKEKEKRENFSNTNQHSIEFEINETIVSLKILNINLD